MKPFSKQYDLLIALLVVAGFVLVASQRLATAPMPDDGDESMTLQVPYEILNRGHFGWPMYRYLGGNIETNWHSFRPVYYVMLSGFFKLFGWGLLQGRAFNLTMAALILVIVYVIGRRLFDWRAALVAILMLVADPTFLERSRMVRHDYAAAMFVLVAYLLYEIARDRKKGGFYIASGVAAGAGVMCHTNSLYVVGGIILLMLLSDGLHAFLRKPFYQFSVGALAVMAYEIVFDIVDFKNVRLQYADDKAHFSIFEPGGIWQNITGEAARYQAWFTGSTVFSNTPLVLLHLFQLLTVLAVVYLIFACAIQIRNRRATDSPLVRLLIITMCAVLFLGFTTNHKRKYVLYMVHLSPWFALCAGVLCRDAWEFVKRVQAARGSGGTLFGKFAMASLAVVAIAFAVLLVRQEKRYLSQVNDQNSASFSEFTTALRSIVPDGVCPTSMLRPVTWLAFPEADSCYSTIEGRMIGAVDIAGKDYALIVPARNSAAWMEHPEQRYHLIGEMYDTFYGDFRIFYTGVDPRYLSLPPRHYQFFRNWRGYVSEEQIAGARAVWSADAAKLSENLTTGNSMVGPEGLVIEAPLQDTRGAGIVELGQVDLKPGMVYRINIDGIRSKDRWQVAVADESTGLWLEQMVIDEAAGAQQIEKVFRTLAGNRVKLLLKPTVKSSGGPIYLSRVVISEVASL